MQPSCPSRWLASRRSDNKITIFACAHFTLHRIQQATPNATCDNLEEIKQHVQIVNESHRKEPDETRTRLDECRNEPESIKTEFVSFKEEVGNRFREMDAEIANLWETVNRLILDLNALTATNVVDAERNDAVEAEHGDAAEAEDDDSIFTVADIGNAFLKVFTEQELAKVEENLCGDLGQGNISHDLSQKSWQSFSPGEWLNDEIVNGFFKLLAERDEHLCQGTGKKRCHFFSSFFMAALLNCGNDWTAGLHNCQKVKKWTKKVPGMTGI